MLFSESPNPDRPVPFWRERKNQTLAVGLSVLAVVGVNVFTLQPDGETPKQPELVGIVIDKHIKPGDDTLILGTCGLDDRSQTGLDKVIAAANSDPQTCRLEIESSQTENCTHVPVGLAEKALIGQEIRLRVKDTREVALCTWQLTSHLDYQE